MRVFRYNLTGRWYKGSTHVHSTASDGRASFDQLAQLYSSAGYDFICRTDHWVASNAGAETGSSPLVWIDGIELDGRDSTGSEFHVVALGTFQGLDRSIGLEQAMERAREQGGLLILAHPLWCGNSLEDALRYPFDGVEVFNHVCHWLNGKGDGLTYWNAVLTRRPACMGFASDDAHMSASEPGWNHGWVVVNSPECTQAAVLESLRAGNFYASTGPEIESIQFDGACITLRSSPVRFARLVGPAWHGERLGSVDLPLLTEASFTLPEQWSYAYIELEDEQGHRAWTNNIFEFDETDS